MSIRQWQETAGRQAVLALALACLCGPGQATEPQAGAASSELPNVIVHGKKDAFIDSDRRLAALKASLPLLGTDRPVKSTLVDRTAAYYNTHRDPNDLDTEQQILLLQLMGTDLRVPNPAAP